MRILHLYPELMNLYGEYGNVLVLKKHLEDQGLEVTIDRKDVEESIDFDRYDMIYMGSGTEKNQLIALKDLLKYKYYYTYNESYLKKILKNIFLYYLIS